MKKFIVVFFFILVSAPLQAQNIGALRLKTVDGTGYDFQKQIGHGPVVLAFWATWCKPCRKELPALKALYERYREQGLEILAISLDSPRSQAKVRSYIKSSGLPYTFLVDPNGSESGKLYVKDVPYTLLADKNGDIVYSQRGYRKGDETELEAEIAKLYIAEKEE